MNHAHSSDTPDETSDFVLCADVERAEPEQTEPCPTPLEWHDVVENFVREADHWYFEYEGQQILGRSWGSGCPLYFLNGLTGTHELLALTAYLLRDDFCCVLFDYPDVSPIEIHELANILPALAEQQGHQRISLYAPGWGAQVALAAAVRHPELIQTMILSNPSIHLSLSAAERGLATCGRFTPGRFRRIPGRWMIQQRSHRVWFPPYDESRFQFYVDNTGQQLTRHVAARFLAGGRFDATASLPKIQQPVLVIRTEGEGPIQQHNAEQLVQQLPQAHVEWMHTSGLLPFLTHPHRLAKLLDTFLNEHHPA